MDLFSLSLTLGKQAIKQMAKEQVKNLVVEAARQSIPKKMVSDQFVFYKSAKSVDSSMSQLKDTMNAFEKLSKMSNEQTYSSLNRTYQRFTSFGDNLDRISERSVKQAIRDKRLYNLTEHDLNLFMKSQFNRDKGTLNIKELAQDPKLYEASPVKYRIEGYNYYNIDRVIGKHIDNGTINLERMSKDTGKHFNKRIESRLEQLKKDGLIVGGEGELKASQAYLEALGKLNNSYSDMDYRIYKTIAKNGDIEHLKGNFKSANDSFQFAERMDYLKQKGYIKVTGDNLEITEAYKSAHEKYVSFLKDNTESFLESKFEAFEKMGLLNKHKSGTYEVTDLFYKNFKTLSDTMNYQSTYFDDRLIQSIGEHKPFSEVKEIFTSGNFDKEYLELRFKESMDSLIDKGIIKVDLENDSIEILSNVRVKDKTIDFSFYDVNLYRNFNEGKMTIQEFNQLSVSEQRRLKNHLHHGLLEIDGFKLNLTEEGLKMQSDFLSGVKLSKAIENFRLDKVTDYLSSKETFTIKEMVNDTFIKEAYAYLEKQDKSFVFGKYDANVIMKDFMNPITKEEYLSKLADTMVPEKLDAEASIRLRRIEKLIENGYMSLNDKMQYTITEHGLEMKKAMSKFSFTEYDSNVLFKYIEERGGLMSKEQLKESLSSVYKGAEVKTQFEYNLRRLNSNMEIGTVKHDGLNYSITDKGKNLQEELMRKKLAHVEQGLVSKVEYLKHLGFVEEREGVVHFTDSYRAFAQSKDFSVSNLDVNIYNKLSEKPIDLSVESKMHQEKYNPKNAMRQDTILKGRLDKLESLGLVYRQDDVFKATERFHTIMKDYERFKSLDDSKMVKNLVENEFKQQGTINQFTFKNVTDVADDRLWTKDKHIKAIGDDGLLERTEKHLQKLSQLGYAVKVDEGYLIHDELFERSQLMQLSREKRYTEKQLTFMTTLRDFQSISSTQAEKYIFENQNISTYSLNELCKKGVIDFKIKNIDGSAERIYYLKSKGKKELVALTGEEKQVFDSKILSRPQEVKHDLYVYSAYKDYERVLESKNMRIVDVKTDKDIRSLVNSGKIQNNYKTAIKVEFADLYIEYENISTLERGYVNIEVDVGYSEKVIKGKCDSIDNLLWYTDSEKQMNKILKVEKTASVKTISL